MKYIVLTVIVGFMAGLVFKKLNQKEEQITELKRQIEDMHSIQRWQESIMRECGFYGKEE